MDTNKELHGIWRIIPSTTLTEIIGNCNFDFQILDCEHGSYDFGSLAEDIRACELTKCDSIVRVSGLNAVEVQKCLDLGAGGIIFPQLQNYDDFVTATKLMKYAPGGLRGYNPFVRAFRYGNINQKGINRPLCVVIIETLEAVKNLEKIILLEEIDIFYIGSYDLSAQLGCAGKMEDPNLLSVIETIIQKCKSVFKPVGVMINNFEQYEKYKKMGVKLYLHSVDSFNIQQHFSRIIEKYK
jgi:2-keto-3-deoxy-L-rhamnonate aldolase RhmA